MTSLIAANIAPTITTVLPYKALATSKHEYAPSLWDSNINSLVCSTEAVKNRSLHAFYLIIRAVRMSPPCNTTSTCLTSHFAKDFLTRVCLIKFTV